MAEVKNTEQSNIGFSFGTPRIAESYFTNILHSVAGVPGDVVECGVWRGNTFSIITKELLNRHAGKSIHGFDSWQPMQPQDEDYSLLRDLANSNEHTLDTENTKASKEEVISKLLADGIIEPQIKKRVHLYEGWLQDTLPEFEVEELSFINLDIDMYHPYKTALTHLWPKLNVGGVVALDEYTDTLWPGCRLAVDEYFRHIDRATFNIIRINLSDLESDYPYTLTRFLVQKVLK